MSVHERLLKMKPERVFADTNLFLRYLSSGMPAQADAVERLLRRSSDGEIILVIISLVIAEIVWTLESYYGLSRNGIKDKVLAIFNTPGLEAAEGDLLLEAIFWYAEKNIDFLDALSAAWMFAEGLDTTYTFDRRHSPLIEGIRAQVPGE
jgi:predicted nucleic-acid-binding protein